MLGYISKSDYITSSLKTCMSVLMTVTGKGSIAHSVVVKGSYLKNVIKVNGRLRISEVFRIFDPARSSTYYMSVNHVNKNVLTIFSIWR